MKNKMLSVTATALAVCAKPSFALEPAEQSQAASTAEPTDKQSNAIVSPKSGEPHVVPALTPVKIEVLANLGSKISKSLDKFPIRLAEPILIDGKELVPAGTPGVGEVVHAKKSGGMGAAGELVLAARYLDVNGRRLPLRSLNLSRAGQSSINTVNAINVGSAASPIPFGVIGFLIAGVQVTVPEGTTALAKTAADFEISPLPDATGEATDGAKAHALPDDPGQPAIQSGVQ